MKNLKTLRVGKNMSQQKLAEKFNISQQSIWKYENDIAQPDLETLIAFANFFNTSIDYLVGNTNNPRKYETLTEMELNDNELQLIRFFRSSPPPIQQLMNQILITILDQLNV